MSFALQIMRRAALYRKAVPAAASFCRTMTSYNPKEIESELKKEHYKAQHAFDDSRGDFDAPKTAEQMKELNHLYHKIDALERDLASAKAMLRDAQRTFAIDAPDGESDGHIQEEMEEIKNIIDNAASKNDKAWGL